MKRALEEMLERVRSWPEHRQREALRSLQELEEAGEEPYQLTDDEMALVQEALEEADRGEFAAEEEVKAFFQRNKRR